MADLVVLDVMEGERRVRELSFDHIGTVTFGRARDCSMSFPDDRCLSRRHFVLEIKPPSVTLRDLGSRNGTYVNGVKYGGREEGVTATEAAEREHPNVPLKDGDRIRAGQLVLAVRIVTGAAIVGVSETAMERQSPPAAAVAGRVRCSVCGKFIANRTAEGSNPAIRCAICRTAVMDNPLDVMRQILKYASSRQDSEAARKLPGYTIHRELGACGCGGIYLAQREGEVRQTVLKVLMAEITLPRKKKKQLLQRILRHQKRDPSRIAPFVDHGPEGITFYFCMEAGDGELRKGQPTGGAVCAANEIQGQE